MEVPQRSEKASVGSNLRTGWKNTYRKSEKEILPSSTANTEGTVESVENQFGGYHVNT